MSIAAFLPMEQFRAVFGLDADAVSVVLGTLVMGQAWKAILSSCSGWFPFMTQPAGYGKMFTLILTGYLIVVGFDFRRIRNIPMDEALKNVE